MSQFNISPYIQELLLRDQFASVPGLGGFLLKTAAPTLNNFTKELKPAHSQVVFNHQLVENDGQLAHLISVACGITYKEAMHLLSSTVADLKHHLKQKKYASFFPFGNFFLNDSGNIFFVARTQYNLHLPNYGLQPLKWELEPKQSSNTLSHKKPISRSINGLQEVSHTPVEATVVGVSEEAIRYKEREHHRSIWWNIAASFVLISVSVLTLGVATLTWIGAYQKHQLASMTPDFSDISASESNATDINNHNSYVLVNGKLISLNEKSGKSSSEAGPSNHNSDQKEALSEHKDLPETSNANSGLNKLNPQEYFDWILTQSGAFFLTGGSYITENAAKIERDQWTQIGTPACIFKPSNSSFYRIVLGRFTSKEEINDYSVTIKTIPNANLSIHRWNLK